MGQVAVVERWSSQYPSVTEHGLLGNGGRTLGHDILSIWKPRKDPGAKIPMGAG